MPAAEASPSGARPSVLVVDDDRGPREALRLILQAEFEVTAVDSGESALAALRSRPVDVVTLDLKMPGLSGSQTLALMREIDPEVEVIIVTGFGTFESAVEVLRLRACDYIAKPFDPRKILERVRRAALERTRRNPRSVVGPLDAVIDAAREIERGAAERLSERDRAALDRIQIHARALREDATAEPRRPLTALRKTGNG